MHIMGSKTDCNTSFQHLLPSEKIDTLCLLVQRIVAENSNLKGEIVVTVEQCEKQKEAKEAIKALNQHYKKQVSPVAPVDHITGTICGQAQGVAR